MRVLRTLIIIAIILGLLIIGGAYAYHAMFSSHTYKEINYQDLGIDEENDYEEETGIVNIALFGVDARHGETSRSDAIIIASIDSARGKVKLSSLMRDSYVEIEGHGKEKLTHAYAYGGPELAIKTINQTFDLDIKEYATVNFDNMEKIADILGGVTVDVTENERKEANKFIREYASAHRVTPDLIEEAGTQKLSGMQVVAYGRIRKGNTGDDPGRMARQQSLLTAMMNELMNVSITRYPALLTEIMPHVESSLSSSEILALGKLALKNGKPTISSCSFPYETDWYGETTSVGWVAKFSDSVAAEKIHRFIYDDIMPGEEPPAEED